MNELSRMQNFLLRSGALLMVVGATVYLLFPMTAAILFSIGSVLFALMQLQQRYDGRNLVILRLRRQQLFGATAWMLAALAMMAQTLGYRFVQHNEWVICLLVGIVLELYTTLRLSAEFEKEKKR